MNGIRDMFGLKSSRESMQNAYKRKLFNEFRELYAQMQCTEMWFQMEEDEDLIEASIYQRESLRARYRYLLKKAKAGDVTKV